MKEKGLTTIELLITIGIIALIAGLIFMGYWGAKKRIDIDNAANSIASTLMDLRLKSMTTDKLRGFMTEEGCMSGRECYATFTFDDANGNYKIDEGEKKDISYFHLPSYIRFEYNPPDTSLTVFFDKRGFPRDENGNFAQKSFRLVVTQEGKKLERIIEVSMRISIKRP